MLRLLIAILLWTLPALPQARPSKLPLAALKVEGNKIYSESDIIAVSGLKIGEAVGKDDFEAAHGRLLATGAFESAGYRFDPAQGGKAYSGTLQVSEIQQVYPMRFESLHVDEKALLAHLKETLPLFRDKLPGTKEMLDRVTKASEAWLAKNGSPTNVIAKLVSISGGKLEIVVLPRDLPSVAELAFVGNKAVETRILRDAVAGPAVGAIFTEPKFREILDTSARPIYESIGRLRASWDKLDVGPAKDVKGLVVTVHINEGDEFKLRNVEISKPDAEDKPAINENALLKEGAFEVNEVANFTKVRQGVERMEQSLRRKGYLEVKSKTDRTIDDKAKTVDVKISLDPGPLFTFHNLTIQGLDIETEPHIRKLWAMKKGQPFNIEYPDYFLNRIREDNVMDNLGRTKSVVEPNPGNGTVDVTLIFEGEKPPAKPPQP